MKLSQWLAGKRVAPGLRVVKTGIAVTLCLCISNVFQLGQPIASAIAAAAVMGKSIDFSLRTARDGAAGAVFGAAAGFLLALIDHGNAGLCGIGVIVTLYLCVLLHMEKGVLLAELTFLAVMLNPAEGPLWFFALTCAGDALLGIAVALAVNLVVMPHHYAGEVRDNYELLRAVAAQSLHAARAGAPIPSKEFHAQTEKLSRSIEAYISERRLLRGSDEQIFQISCKLALFRELGQELNNVQNLLSPENARIPESDREVLLRYHMARLESLAASCLSSKEKKIAAGTK